MQISLAFSANLLSETPSISPLKGEARPSKSPKTHPKIRDFRGLRKNTPKIKDFSGTPKRPCTTQYTSYKTKNGDTSLHSYLIKPTEKN